MPKCNKSSLVCINLNVPMDVKLQMVLDLEFDLAILQLLQKMDLLPRNG
jgi:hypothetical protein